jgi:hypothetical protein
LDYFLMLSLKRYRVGDDDLFAGEFPTLKLATIRLTLSN